MLSMRVLACVAMLPALVVAERFAFGGGCDSNFDNSIDPLAHTEEGLITMKEFFAGGSGNVYLWNPSEKEKKFTGMTLSSVDGTLSTFALTYTASGSVVPTVVAGTVLYQFQPKMMLKLTTAAADSLAGIFSFESDGVADLYPLYVGDNDLILRGCTNAFFGRMESLYVMSHQDYSELDSACSIAAIKEKFFWDVTAAS